MTDRPMYVYFVEAVGAGIIKIGVTVDVSQRVSDLQSCFPYQLKLLTFIPGGLNLERTLHMLFHEHRFKGEWFNAEPVRDWIVAGCVVPDELSVNGLGVPSGVGQLSPEVIRVTVRERVLPTEPPRKVCASIPSDLWLRCNRSVILSALEGTKLTWDALVTEALSRLVEESITNPLVPESVGTPSPSTDEDMSWLAGMDFNVDG